MGKPYGLETEMNPNRQPVYAVPFNLIVEASEFARGPRRMRRLLKRQIALAFEDFWKNQGAKKGELWDEVWERWKRANIMVKLESKES